MTKMAYVRSRSTPPMPHARTRTPSRHPLPPTSHAVPRARSTCARALAAARAKRRRRTAALPHGSGHAWREERQSDHRLEGAQLSRPDPIPLKSNGSGRARRAPCGVGTCFVLCVFASSCGERASVSYCMCGPAVAVVRDMRTISTREGTTRVPPVRREARSSAVFQFLFGASGTSRNSQVTSVHLKSHLATNL